MRITTLWLRRDGRFVRGRRLEKALLAASLAGLVAAFAIGVAYPVGDTSDQTVQNSINN